MHNSLVTLWCMCKKPMACSPRKFHYYCKSIPSIMIDDFSDDAMLHVSDIMSIPYKAVIHDNLSLCMQLQKPGKCDI